MHVSLLSTIVTCQMPANTLHVQSLANLMCTATWVKLGQNSNRALKLPSDYQPNAIRYTRALVDFTQTKSLANTETQTLHTHALLSKMLKASRNCSGTDSMNFETCGTIAAKHRLLIKASQ
jgi:hypothetical protein